MRRALDALYLYAGYLAAVFMIGTLVMVLTSVLGRLLHFHLRGTDAYAGYCMAAAGFLALAHTLKHGDHIKVTLITDRLSPHVRHWLGTVAALIGAVFATVFAYYAVKLCWQSYVIEEISQANDASPLWIPQLGMAIGASVFAIALIDELLLHVMGRHRETASQELKLME